MADQHAPAPGTFCWNELMTGDVSAATAFYTKLFGWRARVVPMGTAGEYTLLMMGDKEVAGLMRLPQEGVPPSWLSYVAVESVDAAVRSAASLGGKTLRPPTDIPGVGRFAVLQDPTDAVFAVFQRTRA
jgi:predicted enzyme related to lactoylglutathione lyase